MSDKVQDGLKATATKIAQYGPGELKRAGDQAVWTKTNRKAVRALGKYLIDLAVVAVSLWFCTSIKRLSKDNYS
jgi:hypothetical protein